MATEIDSEGCLTLRSSGLAPAWHLAREALTVIVRLAGQAPSRRSPLSSNVRQHHVALKVLAFASGAAVAAEYQMPSSATVVQARNSKSGNAQVPRSALLQRQFRLQRFAATSLCRSMRWYQSVRGSAATRKALPSFTAGNGGGLSGPCASSPRWRVGGQWRKAIPVCFVILHRLGPPQAVLPNPSLEPTRTGMALGPPPRVVHHPSGGPSAIPALAPQLKR